LGFRWEESEKGMSELYAREKKRAIARYAMARMNCDKLEIQLQAKLDLSLRAEGVHSRAVTDTE
jgi:hypothetical protein